MWKCKKCGEEHENQFDSCWRCGGTESGGLLSGKGPKPLKCLRCFTRLDFFGTKRFHEGTRLGFLGELGELFVNRESFDVYACPHCGKVEFFLDGVGEEKRSEE